MEPRRYRPARGNLTQLVGPAGLSALLGVVTLAPAADQISRWRNEMPRVLVEAIPSSLERKEPPHVPGTFFQQVVLPTSSSGTGSTVLVSTRAAYSAPEIPLAWEVAKVTEDLHADDYVPAFILKLRSA